MLQDLRFGIEIELGGRSREEASQIIANYFGTRKEYEGTCYRTWVAYDREGRKWRVMSDSSVHAGNESCEIVSPLLNYSDIEDLQEVVRQLRRNGYKADHTCGIHVHVDNTGMTARQIKNLVNFVGGREEIIYQALQIREEGRERWCQKMSQSFNKKLNSIRKLTEEEIKKAWYQTQSGCLDNSNVHYDSSRYHLLNLHSMWQGKGIEFRCFNGTTHAGKIKAYIQFCLAMVDKAKNLKWAQNRQIPHRDSLEAMGYILDYLGLTGEEFKTCRTHMLANLTHDLIIEAIA